MVCIAEEIKESRSPSPSPPNKPCGERNRESSWSDSDDNTGCPPEDFSPANTEDDDSAYDELVEGITNIILESSCVGNVEDRGVPVKLYVHNLLERVLNHPRSPSESQVLCLPIRNPPTQNNEGPGDAGEQGMDARGQSGNGGSSGMKKRKSNEASGHNRNGSYGDQDDFDDDPGEVQAHNPQKVKKQKTGKRGGNFSCPFRKRNPIRFNVRDHESCALKPFADFALLKRHIKTFHQKANSSSSCVRCKEQFPDQAALNYHLTRRNICPVRDPTGDEDPEEGITEEIDRALKVRTKDDNVRLWESLWKLLFPRDPPEHIPGPEHEPPYELDEVQNHCYKGDSVREFIRKETIGGETVITAHGFRYMAESFEYFFNSESHKPSKVRVDRDKSFLAMVDNELPTRHGASQAQQVQPTVVCDPPDGATQAQWENGFDDDLSLGIDLGLYTSQIPYPTFPVYASHLGVNGSQTSASTMHPSSQDPTQYADPQGAPTAFTYGAMPPQSGSPCSAAGGSAHHSSGPSSRSRDSGDLTLETQETQNTQYTQQEQHDAALLLHSHHCCYRAAGDDAGPCGQGCSACGCSAPSPGGTPGGRHSATCPAGQGSSEHSLYGVGTSSFARPECLDGSNSDEDLGPIPDM
ncbi:hypothetical protein INS49_013592 [Diaporthe citri]|uniref:uncharacterized protein n=1 Tax=Diaporthe citri TaxID=83186 RepID=UPI001C820106|nr:uncharacterized protein INS49_013592 [Diaporthe citri]KAG6357713.1 hypothetical protein INS49_013592 [Diaporthe citri]